MFEFWLLYSFEILQNVVDFIVHAKKSKNQEFSVKDYSLHKMLHTFEQLDEWSKKSEAASFWFTNKRAGW